MQMDSIVSITQAEIYASILGILAGFSFAILGWLVQKLDGANSTRQQFLISRSIVFIGLTFTSGVISAIFWGITAATAEVARFSLIPRANMVFYVASVHMTFIAPVTLEGIIYQIFSVTRSPVVIRVFRRVFLMAVFVSYMFLLVTTLAIFDSIHFPDEVLLVLVLASMLASAAFVVLAFVNFNRPDPPETDGMTTEEQLLGEGFSSFIASWIGFVLISTLIVIIALYAPVTAISVLCFVPVLFFIWVYLIMRSLVLLPNPRYESSN